MAEALGPSLRERQRLQTRRDIFQAAAELFEAQGCARTTVDEIARRAGVSSSTFFRNFTTKEESVVGRDLQFEADVTGWLNDTARERMTLAGLESVFEESVQRLTALPDDLGRLRRARRLVRSDASLRSAAFMIESVVFARITDDITDKLGSESCRPVARMMVEIAGTAMRAAFDTWAQLVDGGDGDVDLADVYRRTRATRDLMVMSATSSVASLPS